MLCFCLSWLRSQITYLSVCLSGLRFKITGLILCLGGLSSKLTYLCFCLSVLRSYMTCLWSCLSGLRSILLHVSATVGCVLNSFFYGSASVGYVLFCSFSHTHTPYVSVKYNYSIRGWGGVGGIRCTGPGYVLFKDWIASPSSRNITQSFNIQYTVFKLKLRVVFIRRKDFEKMGFDLPLSIYKVKSQYRNLFFPNCLSGFVLDSSRR